MTSTDLKTDLPIGNLTATLDLPDSEAKYFNATDFDVYKLNGELHIWAQQGEADQFEAIFLRIPFDTSIATGAKGIRAAFLTRDAGGYAQSVKLLGFAWGKNKQSVEIEFGFSVQFESREYKVTGGALKLSYGELSDQKSVKAVAGTVSATVAPPVFPGYGAFQSSSPLFVEAGPDFHRLIAEQAVDGAESGKQGIMLRISNAAPELGGVAFFIKGQQLLLASEYSLQKVEWNKQERTFKAEFTFKFLNDMHTVSAGKIDLKY
ncbi:hypothetical protein [Pseudomonas putida]|uniref:hypothetical protein n=1 Tax=Pseudomonas putida TaxID=303 RepID=UPI00236660BF|nr:hypothetical protein [Pseudomonas putida]MDD2050138.1 hypothetical protein [Pseudomonas putida]